MNWLLIVVIAILIINALIGRKIGLIKIIFSLCSVILTLVLTVWISPTVNNFLKENDKFYSMVIENVEKFLPIDEKETKKNEQISYIEKMSVPKSIKETLIENNNKDIYKALAVKTFREYIVNYMASIVINAIAFILTFLIILIILWVISIALDIISKLPILNQINKTAGLLAGLVQGLIFVWVFFLIITVMGGTEFGREALNMIDENDILSFIYNNNYLLGFVTNATKLFF
ncbi:MAG: hypothetical protein GX306_05650 [Clostridiales bacterium]|jgi:uncharacterized membrane protein required for colicin V production|nr:hypothetical protein [Clostridiales bacterium]